MADKETITRITGLQRELSDVMRRHSSRRWISLDLGMVQIKCLFHIVENPGINHKRLAELMGVTPANITGIAGRIIDKGLAQRAESVRDRRVSMLEATDAGRALINSLEQTAMDHASSVLNRLSESELEHLYKGLSAFLRAARAHLAEEIE
ncbi:MAG: MarR family transcriptional regulator [Dehalococcoidia bacterium]|nr:MarR family transcriptional regulator [Dehalococcoidia bacterium]